MEKQHGLEVWTDLGSNPSVRGSGRSMKDVIPNYKYLRAILIFPFSKIPHS